MESVATDQAAYERAVRENDEAHLRAIHTVPGVQAAVRQELFASINREAKMWLEHLDFIHHRI